MNDKELLIDAAKAAGYKVHGDCGDGALWVHPEGAEIDHYGELPIVKFDPLTDDGDRYRLAKKLKMILDFDMSCVHSGFEIYQWGGAITEERAVLIAAAEIGRAMP